MEATIVPASAPEQVIAGLVKELIRRDQKVQRGKRTHIRYSLNCAVKIGLVGDTGAVKPFCDAWGVDLSLKGIGLLSQQELLPGRNFCVGLQGLTGAAGWVTIRISYSQRLIGTMVRSGGAFVFPNAATSAEPKG
jgi:hypothetical protein